MARVLKEVEHATKRGEIIDSALRLVYTKGYERMTIQDILDDLHISKGAFYHYFDSKPAVLQAITERIQVDVQAALIDLTHDPQASGLNKLQRFFSTFDRFRMADQSLVIQMLHIWYTDDNAIVRQKVDAAIVEWRAPLLNEIVRQGIREGDFSFSYTDQAGEIILALLQSMSTSHAHYLLTFAKDHNELRCIDGIVHTHAAYMDAVERILGAPSNVFYRTDSEAVRIWITAMRKKQI